MIHFLSPARGSFSIEEYLARDGSAIGERMRVVHYEDLPAHGAFTPGTYVLAALDQLEGAAERNVYELARRLSGAPGVRILNDPVRTLRRFDLLTTLHQLHRNDFRVTRADGDLTALRYPVYLRRARSHDGNISPLLHSVRDVERALGRAVMQGYPWHDMIVIEFCSTANADGVYRKYAAYKVGSKILARCLFIGRPWMLKFENSDFTRSIVLEEQEYVMRNPHADQLAEIFEIAKVDFGEIDYSMKDGRVQTWEINLNPTIGRTSGPHGGIGPKELWPIRDETREYFFDRFRESWADVDLPSDGHPAISITLERPAPPVRTLGRRVLELTQTITRPVKRVLEPVSGPFLRLLVVAMRNLRRTRRTAP